MYALSSYPSDDLFTDKQHAFMTLIINDDVTHSYKEAVKFKVWRDAIGTEVSAFEIADTWDVTTLPLGCKSIGKQMDIHKKNIIQTEHSYDKGTSCNNPQ